MYEPTRPEPTASEPSGTRGYRIGPWPPAPPEQGWHAEQQQPPEEPTARLSRRHLAAEADDDQPRSGYDTAQQPARRAGGRHGRSDTTETPTLGQVPGPVPSLGAEPFAAWSMSAPPEPESTVILPARGDAEPPADQPRRRARHAHPDAEPQIEPPRFDPPQPPRSPRFEPQQFESGPFEPPRFEPTQFESAPFEPPRFELPHQVGETEPWHLGVGHEPAPAPQTPAQQPPAQQAPVQHGDAGGWHPQNGSEATGEQLFVASPEPPRYAGEQLFTPAGEAGAQLFRPGPPAPPPAQETPSGHEQSGFDPSGGFPRTGQTERPGHEQQRAEEQPHRHPAVPEPAGRRHWWPAPDERQAADVRQPTERRSRHADEPTGFDVPAAAESEQAPPFAAARRFIEARAVPVTGTRPAADDAPPVDDRTAETPVVGGPAEQPAKLDAESVLAAVRDVPGVRAADLRTDAGGGRTLRLDVAEGVDTDEITAAAGHALRDRLGVDARLAVAAGTGYELDAVDADQAEVEHRPSTNGALDTARGSADRRAIIERIQIATAGAECAVEVCLTADGVRAVGRAGGPALDPYLLRVAALATADAVGVLAGGRARCAVEHVDVVTAGPCRVVVVVLVLMADERAERLVGSAVAGGDARQATVRATMSALNRRLGPLLDSVLAS
ncbi:hypothetical protein [Actinocatenispora rupis]|uniref:Uncharacterized protein n=1 Tax=Actinocatenispora rupis TaxID=519421 RepID=A0A8J3JGS5_9ACTN|nr:hypothetical protein [Actinocatenispora rupis]GID16107.1 hypothetical protein Aru02nite_69960 [Actinocatenispora rupis]